MKRHSCHIDYSIGPKTQSKITRCRTQYTNCNSTIFSVYRRHSIHHRGHLLWELTKAVIDGPCISCVIVLRWMSLDLTYDKSTLVQSQCWARFMSPYDVTRLQCDNREMMDVIYCPWQNMWPDNNHYNYSVILQSCIWLLCVNITNLNNFLLMNTY